MTAWSQAPAWAQQLIRDKDGYYFWFDGANKFQLVIGQPKDQYTTGIEIAKVIDERGAPCK